MLISVLLFLIIANVHASNRYVRSCSNKLQTAFQALLRNDQVIISVPEEERHRTVNHIPTIYNQPCNQEAFYKI